MAETHFLSLADVLALHELMMERFGLGPSPLRDEGLLESAIMRPQMAAYYSNADIIRQSALLTVGISQAFMDGNKRTAFAACDVFLRLNGLFFAGEPLAIARQIEAVTQRKGDIEAATDQFEQWLREHVAIKANIR
ncbi:MAG TPA: type II toxin-antitoxin system death-on-curing family toxin [Ktedonobacteraceae bacterium]|nr:type II toxin-antitoxin system death-on-curing family toxin [Ktedonobacteraceae bacterium]